MSKQEIELSKEYLKFCHCLVEIVGAENKDDVINNYRNIRSLDDEVKLKEISEYRNNFAFNINYTKVNDERINEWIDFLKVQKEFCENNRELIKEMIEEKISLLEIKFLNAYAELCHILDELIEVKNKVNVMNNYRKVSTIEDEEKLNEIRDYRNRLAHNASYSKVSNSCLNEWIDFLKVQKEFCKNNKELIKEKFLK